MTRKALLGSISHGTLRTQDLLRAFADELAWQNGSRIGALIANAEACADAIDEADAKDELDTQAYEDAAETLIELEDELNNRAPAYCYFGAHIGDGSDFGYWPDWMAIEELPRISDPSEHAGEECVFVNDHGNVTIYAADGSVIFDCV